MHILSNFINNVKNAQSDLKNWRRRFYDFKDFHYLCKDLWTSVINL